MTVIKGSMVMPVGTESQGIYVWFKWIGTFMGMSGAVLIAMNIPSSGYGFYLFLVSTVCWTIVGWHLREMSLVLLNLAFIGINILGIYRWVFA